MKFKVLESNRKVFQLMWIIPTPKTEKTSTKLRNFVFSVCNFCFTLSTLIAGVRFVSQFVATDLELALYAVFQVAGFTVQVYSLAVGYTIGPKLIKLFASLQRIYDESKSTSRLETDIE